MRFQLLRIRVRRQCKFRSSKCSRNNQRERVRKQTFPTRRKGMRYLFVWALVTLSGRNQQHVCLRKGLHKTPDFYFVVFDLLLNSRIELFLYLSFQTLENIPRLFVFSLSFPFISFRFPALKFVQLFFHTSIKLRRT